MTRRPRSSILACVLGFLAPGLGHLYLGRAARFAIPAVLFLAAVGALALVGALSTFAGFLAAMGALVVLYFFSVVDPPILARRIETFDPKWYNRWYVYVAWVVVVSALRTTLPGVREPVLGYGTYRISSNAPAPGLASGEFVLADTWAYRSRAPAVGDVVVVRGPGKTGDLFIRRVAMLRDGLVFLVADDSRGGSVSDLERVSAAQVVGQVTYVLFSHTWDRIGRRVE